VKPQIITPDIGRHNRHFKGSSYKDQSTIIVCPTRGLISSRVVSSWVGLIRPMNQPVIGPVFFQGFEVGDAYEHALTFILDHPDLKRYRYLLTIEEDNILPGDGLLRLLETIERFDAAGALYFTKGIEGRPMCYGPPQVQPRNFVPFLPQPDTVQPCNGVGMGMTLFRLAMFRSGKLKRPFFKSMQEQAPGKGFQCFSQDLYFFNQACEAGFKMACDARVKVGHYDAERNEVW
jgi:hypothetical protein